MPPRSRRSLLALLGAATATAVAGCRTAAPSETDTRGTSPTGSPSPTDAETAADTESPTGSPGWSGCGPAPRPDAAWPVGRRSPARDGYVVDPQGFDEAPTTAWEAEPSAPADSHASPRYGRPVVAGGRVYLLNLLDRGPQISLYGRVHALDAGTGERGWASERFRSPEPPVIRGDLAVVLAENDSLEARLHAFDRTDGSRRWTREFAPRADALVGAGEHLYLVLGEGTGPRAVHAFADDGTTVWSRADAFDGPLTRGPVVGPGHVYAATNDGRLHALARDDGTAAWTHRFERPAEERPYVTDVVATDCAVFAVVEGAVHALDDSGTPVWYVAGDHGPLATDGETVYAVADSDSGQREVRALNARTGEVRWSVRRLLATHRPPVVVGDTLLVGSDGAVVALDRGDGTERWRMDRSLGDLALADGTLYGTDRGALVALR